MTQKISAIIVDDEDLARSILREYLDCFPEVSVVAECSNGFEAVKAITELKPRIVFLDIQMPKLNGFEVLELIDENPAVVFVTAYDAYALKAFEIHAVDYVLKPFSRERLAEALKHAMEHVKSLVSSSIPGLVSEARRRNAPLERILVRDGSKVHVIAIRKVDYLEAQDDYVCIKSQGKEYLKQMTLSELEESLDPTRFVRIHRSFILNLERLEKLEQLRKDTWTAILTTGARIPVSRTGYARLKTLL